MKAFGLARFLGETWFWFVIFVTGLGLGAFITCAVRVGVGTSELSRWPEMATAFLALIAFILSMFTFRFTAAKSQKDLFVLVHDKLITPDMQEGRGILAERVHTRGDVDRLDSRSFKSVNASLALFDTLAMYALNGDMNLADVRETWGVAMHQRARQMWVFMDYREEKDRYQSWPHLRKFLRDLERTPPQYPGQPPYEALVGACDLRLR